MSNTGRKKKLASFNCDQKMWSQFIARCNSKGTTATATLTQFIELYLDDDRDNLDAIGDGSSAQAQAPTPRRSHKNSVFRFALWR
ncbi:hypothetical protein LC653_45345 [Nostoc sp. CHAB 5784]|uniref:hypothetical protein n=1 Tax=Nostoc mirabile TaxID=2907820 RepID=UPI001E3B119F|nr:hypothetical protein [Nostoc mirabile]MCC5670791.1 hypothetical protein [Nostoc mirabile CHAB5784]